MSKEAEEIGSRKSEIDEVKNAQVITAMAEPMNLLHKCPHCTAVVQTAYGFNGGVRCGSCGRTFHVVPVASVIKPGHAAKKVKSEWQTGTYQCTKDMLTCCCVGFVYDFFDNILAYSKLTRRRGFVFVVSSQPLRVLLLPVEHW
mmetsp:Transcript_15112/g.21189  ORF Transcript_15112/g.21189 Transcript_15112/m.21189 type:complete len:144 (+) Transcript_15112:101-532(+)